MADIDRITAIRKAVGNDVKLRVECCLASSQIFRAFQMPPVFMSLMLMRSQARRAMRLAASVGEKTALPCCLHAQAAH